MKIFIKKMQPCHEQVVIQMMRDFYRSDAVISNGSEEIFLNDFNACVGDDPFLEGYVFECDGEISGYGMLSMGFSTESGKRRIGIEDIYVLEKYRGVGIGGAFLDFISNEYSDCIQLLQVEEENQKAIDFYKNHGFKFVLYREMMRNE